MSSPCNARGKSTTCHTYVYPIVDSAETTFYAAGNLNVQRTKSLLGDLRTFKYELYTIIDSWRNIYGPFPWTELAKNCNRGDVNTILDIITLRKTVNLKVEMIRLRLIYLKSIKFVLLFVCRIILNKNFQRFTMKTFSNFYKQSKTR